MRTNSAGNTATFSHTPLQGVPAFLSFSSFPVRLGLSVIKTPSPPQEDGEAHVCPSGVGSDGEAGPDAECGCGTRGHRERPGSRVRFQMGFQAASKRWAAECVLQRREQRSDW